MYYWILHSQVENSHLKKSLLVYVVINSHSIDFGLAKRVCCVEVFFWCIMTLILSVIASYLFSLSNCIGHILISSLITSFLPCQAYIYYCYPIISHVWVVLKVAHVLDFIILCCVDFHFILVRQMFHVCWPGMSISEPLETVNHANSFLFKVDCWLLTFMFDSSNHHDFYFTHVNI